MCSYGLVVYGKEFCYQTVYKRAGRRAFVHSLIETCRSDNYVYSSANLNVSSLIKNAIFVNEQQ